jgi:N-acyl-D-amino-acid deacylase
VETLDLVIRNATVVDGTGAAPVAADVGIRGDRIVGVGRVTADALSTIDAAGKVVAPGFIDVHAHDDFAVLDRPTCEAKVMQGVTTEIIGNCGFGAAPLSPVYEQVLSAFGGTLFGTLGELSWKSTASFLAHLEKSRPAINVSTLVPHAPVRVAVMGADARKPTDAELDSMRALVREGMEAGAVGLSTGLFYSPGSFAKIEEIVDLAEVVAEYRGVYASHVRDEADSVRDAIAEAIRVGADAGVAVQISHHKAMGGRNWGAVRDTLAMVDDARRHGIEVNSDVYPYTSASTTLAALSVGGVLGMLPPDAVLLASLHELHEFEGKTLAEASAMLGAPPAETVERLLARDGGGIVAIAFAMSEDDVRAVLTHPGTMIGTDGVPSISGKPHPRLYGTFARILGHYVRDEKLLTIESAIHRMTGLPAAKFHLADRGRVGEGAYADVVIFDPVRVADRATYLEPRVHPAGIETVIVNGSVVVANGRHTGRRQGRVLRFRCGAAA